MLYVRYSKKTDFNKFYKGISFQHGDKRIQHPTVLNVLSDRFLAEANY